MESSEQVKTKYSPEFIYNIARELTKKGEEIQKLEKEVEEQLRNDEKICSEEEMIERAEKLERAKKEGLDLRRKIRNIGRGHDVDKPEGRFPNLTDQWKNETGIQTFNKTSERVAKRFEELKEYSNETREKVKRGELVYLPNKTLGEEEKAKRRERIRELEREFKTSLDKKLKSKYWEASMYDAEVKKKFDEEVKEYRKMIEETPESEKFEKMRDAYRKMRKRCAELQKKNPNLTFQESTERQLRMTQLEQMAYDCAVEDAKIKGIECAFKLDQDGVLVKKNKDVPSTSEIDI